jgi:hypothetical protein
MIKLTQSQWAVIREKLSKENPPSVMLIRYRMREVLGFTVRVQQEQTGSFRWTDYIMLDFYSESMETFFRLKYIDVEE